MRQNKQWKSIAKSVLLQTQVVTCKLVCDYVQEKHACVLEWKKVSDVFLEKNRSLPNETCPNIRVPSSLILTGGFAAVGTREFGFFVLDYRPALLISCRQTLVRLLDQLRRILHLDSRFRFLDQRLKLRLTFLIVRLLIAGLDVTGGVLPFVQCHCRVSNERVSAIRSGTMKMPINTIAVTASQSTINHLVIEGEARRYVDIVVEILTMHEQLVWPIGGEMTPQLRTVMVLG